MNFLKGMFCDKNGTPSSKRMMTFLAFLMFIQAVELNLYRGKILDKELLDYILLMVGAGMGLTTVENLGMKKDSSSTTTTVAQETKTTV